MIAAVAETMREEEIQESIRDLIVARIEDADVAALLGSVIERAIEGGQHEALVNAGLRGVSNAVTDNKDLLRKRIREESPWWVPEPVDDVVFDKLYMSLLRFINEIINNPVDEGIDEG